ncbi:MAG: polysaccharide biosynthesis C-terminal domain-containing protein [Nitrospirota bacterium]
MTETAIRKTWDRIGWEAAWLVAGQGLAALGGLVAIRVLTGHYTREVYGIAWLFINGAGLAITLFAGPLSQALNRFYHDEGGQEQLDRLLALIWRLEVSLILCVGIIYLIAVSLMGRLGGAQWLAYGVMPVYFLFLAAINAAQALLNTSRKRVKRVALIVAEAWLKPAGAMILCLLWKPDVNSFVLGYASASIITGTVGIFWIKGFSGKSLFSLPMPDRVYVRRIISFSLPWAGIAGSGWVLALSDRYLLNWYWGAAITGTYVAAYQVGSALFQFLGGSFGPLVQPLVFQRASEPEACARNISTVFKVFAWVSLPVLSAFVLMHGWLMRWLVAPAYWGGENIVLIVGFGIFFWLMGDRALDVFLIAKKTGSVMRINILAAVVNIVLNLLLIRRYGAIGAAFATLLAYFCYATCMVVLSRKLLAWRFPVRSYVMAGLISATSCVAGVLAKSFVFNRSYGLVSAFGILGIFFVVFASCFWLLHSQAYSVQ